LAKRIGGYCGNATTLVASRAAKALAAFWPNTSPKALPMAETTAAPRPKPTAALMGQI